MRTWEVHQYYPLPWRLGEIVEVSGGKLTSILAANGEKVAIWLDPGVAQVIVEAVNRNTRRPPRNCDRFDDPDKALIAYADSVCRELGEKFFKVARASFVWLFAPANEKEASR